LGILPEAYLQAIFVFPRLHAVWEQDRPIVEAMMVPDGSWAANPGDRRALYYLVQALQPRSVLEIGTYVGCSTLSIALALNRVDSSTGGPKGQLHTVDICDMNDPAAKPWQAHGFLSSPQDLVAAAGCGAFVTFHTADSREFLRTCSRRFDLIFLDGLHDADQVYQEIPLALARLNRGGFILLHDYFPGLKALWSDGTVIPGPYSAIARLRKEGAAMTALPLSALPWPTKLNSNVTSLALLVGIP
jgi:predicted O-methyltransferase YrrM